MQHHSAQLVLDNIEKDQLDATEAQVVAQAAERAAAKEAELEKQFQQMILD